MERRVDSPLTPNPQILTQYPQPLIPLSSPNTLINSPRNIFHFLKGSLDRNEFRFGVLGCVCQDLTNEEWVSGYSLHCALARSCSFLISSTSFLLLRFPLFLLALFLRSSLDCVAERWNLERKTRGIFMGKKGVNVEGKSRRLTRYQQITR
jgi:hypothetical protein